MRKYAIFFIIGFGCAAQMKSSDSSSNLVKFMSPAFAVPVIIATPFIAEKIYTTVVPSNNNKQDKFFSSKTLFMVSSFVAGFYGASAAFGPQGDKRANQRIALSAVTIMTGSMVVGLSNNTK